MCKTRLHMHACGHSRVSVLSSCRFTYTSSTSAPLCASASSPDLVIRVPATCHACEYQSFVSTWQKRIDDFQERCSNLRMLISDLGSRNCCELDDGSDDGEPACDIDFPNDAVERARREYTSTFARYEGLRSEFDVEHETRWPSHAKGRIGFVKSARSDDLKRRRSAKGPAGVGSSPLRWSTTPEMEQIRSWDADEDSAITDSESECEFLSLTSDDQSEESIESIRTGRSASADSLASTASTVYSAVFDDQSDETWIDKSWTGEPENVFESAFSGLARRISSLTFDDEPDHADDDQVDPKDKRRSLNKQDLESIKSSELKESSTTKWLTETSVEVLNSFKSAWAVPDADEIDLPNYGF